VNRDIVLVLASTLAACAPRERPASGLPSAPATALHPVVTRYHSVKVTDPFRWLDAADSPAVRRWIDAQNAYAATVLAGLPDGRMLAARVRHLSTTSPEQSAPRLVGATLFLLRETPPEPQAELVAQRWPRGPVRVLVDPNRLGAAGGQAIAGFWPSPRGRYVVYGTNRNGKPETTLHVLDVRSGRTLPETIAYAGGGVSSSAALWDADERGFTYTRFPVPGDWFNLALYHHRLGDPVRRDSIAFGKGYSPVAEYQLLAAEGARSAAVVANAGDGSPSEVFLRGAAGWRRVADTSLGVRGAAFVGDRLIVIATSGSPRGRLVAIAPDGGSRDALAQGDRAIRGVAPIAGGFLVHTIWGMDQRLDQYTSAGKLVRTVTLPPGIAIGTIASSAVSPEALITYSGWTVPERWVRYDGRSGAVATVFEVTPAADYSGIAIHELDGVSRDGTRVPVTVLALPPARRDSAAPTILTSYGGFDIPVTPSFVGPWLAWLERGGALAFANIRGGDEFGESWHQQAMLTGKQHSYDDFYAAARALVAAKWTDPAHLGIVGRSNGGLLMGAALTQHPEAYRAVAAFVGIYDMMRHQDIPNGRYNIPEYGTADDSAQFAAQYAYSPLYHVKRGTAYPAVLLETGVNDPLVAPWQSREFAAALQGTSTSGHPVLLVTRFDAGHGSSSFGQAVDNTAMTLSFFAHELGLGK
jgi:prolyl oligopeptidase